MLNGKMICNAANGCRFNLAKSLRDRAERATQSSSTELV
jgi:hypothetical protein